MGLLISRWRKKATTEEILEALEKEIDSHHKLKRQNLLQQRQIIGQLIFWSITLYIVLALLFYLSYSPRTVNDKILFSLPYVCFPVIIWLLKRMLHWYFVKRLSKNESTLTALRERKQEILEEVMEKETYKKAKMILEKYDNEKFKQLEKTTASGQPKTPKFSDSIELRQRTGAGPSTTGPGGRGSPLNTPLRPPGQRTPPIPGSANQTPRLNGQPRPGAGGPPLPRPILPRERTAVDKLVEYLVGDGPQNRYALICRHCYSHNGMAMKEEFEFIAFRCCYCYAPNPARRTRPAAPQLPMSIPDPQSSAATSEQSSEQEGEGEDSENDDVTDSNPEVDQTSPQNPAPTHGPEADVSMMETSSPETDSPEADKKND